MSEREIDDEVFRITAFGRAKLLRARVEDLEAALSRLEAVLQRWEGELPPPRNPVEEGVVIALPRCAQEIREALK